jgi:hypothetical protein
MYWTKGLYPIKWDHSLKVSGEITEVMLMVRCCAKESTRKRPERAMVTFLVMEDLINPLIGLEF